MAIIDTNQSILVGPLPQPITGASLAFKMLCDGFRGMGIPFSIVDISPRSEQRRVGSFSVIRLLELVKPLILFMSKVLKCKNVYIILGLSTYGFLRDSVFIMISMMLKKRVVVHIHSGGYGQFYLNSSRVIQAAIRIMFTHVDNIIVLGHSLKNQLSFSRGNQEKIVIVKNGLPIEGIGDISRKRKYSGGGKINLLFLSNMIPSKGYLDLLEACRILVYERQIRIHCSFCGLFMSHAMGGIPKTKENLEIDFREKIESFQLKNYVNFEGVVYGEDKKTVLMNADVFILPTLYAWEGQPLSIIEAMAYGLPVISTKFRGIIEQVDDGQTGFLVDGKSPQQIADCVESLYRNPDLYRDMSNKSNDKYRREFTRETHLSKLIPIIINRSIDGIEKSELFFKGK